MVAQKFLSAVLITIIEHRTIVAGEDDKRVLVEAKLLQEARNLPHRPVELRDGVATKAHGALAAEALMREAGHVNVVGAKIHHKRFVGMTLDEVQGMGRNRVGNVLVLPQGLATALHVSDAANAVYHSHVVAMARLEVIHQLGVCLPCRHPFERLAIAHLNGSRWVVVSHDAVLDEHTWHAIRRGGHEIRVIETQIARSGSKRSVPILLACLVAQAEMPLSYGSRSIAATLEKVGHGELLGLDNHCRIARSHIGVGTTPSIFAREQRVARWCTDRRHGMAVGEARTLLGQLVHVRRGHALSPVASKVAITEVVGHDKDDVGLVGALVMRLLRCRGGECQRHE